MKKAKQFAEDRLEDLVDELKTQIAACQRPANETLLDDRDVMKLLRVCKRTLAGLRAEGIIPYSRIGKKIIYTLADVLSVVEKNKVIDQRFQQRILLR